MAGTGVTGALTSDMTDDLSGNQSSLMDGAGAMGKRPADWSTDGHDLANAGSNPNATGPKRNVSARWILNVTGDDQGADTLVSNGTVYVGGEKGVRAVNTTTGQVVWNSSEFEANYLSVAGGTVYATGERDYSHRVIIAFDATNGSELWNVTESSPTFRSTRVLNGVLYVDCGDEIKTYNATNGSYRWTSDTYDGAQLGGIAMSNDTVYLPVQIDSGSTLSALVALNATDGSERWRFEVNGGIEMTPTVANGTVYLGKGDEEHADDPDPRLYALNPANGSIKWADDANAITHGVAVANGTVYAAMGNSIRAFDEATGAPRWTFKAGGYDYYGSVTNSPAIADGVVYTSNDRGTVYGLNATTGDRLWRYETGGRPEAPVVSGDTLYVRVRHPNNNGWRGSDVYALEANPFQLTGLSTNKTSVTPGQQVSVSVTIQNDDTVSREYNISLIDDRPHVGGELSKGNLSGSLAPSASTTLTFTPTFNVTGEHDLSIRRELETVSQIGPVTVSVEHATPSTDWSMISGNIGRTNTAPNGTGAKRLLQEVWNLSANDGYGYKPVVANGTTYIATRNSTGSYLVAFDEGTGAERWQFNTSNAHRVIDGSPAVANGLVYLTTFPGGPGSSGTNATIYGVYASNGSVKWTKKLAIDDAYANAGDNAPLVANGKVYVAGSLQEDDSNRLGNHDGKFYALNESTGTIDWSYQFGNEGENEFGHWFAVDDRNVYFEVTNGSADGQGGTTEDYELLAVNRTTHQMDWGASNIGQDDVLLAANGYVYTSNVSHSGSDQRMYAYYADNGTKAWQFDRPYGGVNNDAQIDHLAFYDGSLYLDQYYTSSIRADRLYKIDPATGAIRWNKSIADADTMFISDGLLYAGMQEFSDTYLYDAHTGEYLGSSDMGAALSVANGTLYTYLDTTASAGKRFVALRSGAKLVFSNTTVSTGSPRIGENVTVSATVTNAGTHPRSFRTTIGISGASSIDYHLYGYTWHQGPALAPGESTTVSYVVEFRKHGDYQVTIDPKYFYDNGGSPVQDPLDQYTFDEARNVTVSVGDPHDGQSVALPSRSLSVTPNSWPKRGLDANNSAHHTSTTGPTAVGPDVVKWNNTDFEYGWTTAPTVVGDTVYVGAEPYNRDGTLYAINATDGSIEWGYQSEGDLISAPTYADGFLYFGGYYGRLYAVNATTGHMLWSFHAGDVSGAPTVVDGVVYFGTGDDRVYALNASTREVLWSHSVNHAVETSLSVSNGTVYASSGNRVHAFDAATGAEQWNATITDGYDITAPVVDGNTVYVGNTEQLTALDASDGTPRWSVAADLGGDESEFPTTPAVADGVVYFGDDNACQFRAVNATTGNSLWSYHLCSAIDGPPAVVDDIVYFGANDGRVYALDATTGDTVWHFMAIHGYRSSPVVYAPAVVNGVAYVSTYNYDSYPSLYALTGGTSNATVDPFSLSDLSVNETTVNAGQPVKISATVSNGGPTSCSYTAHLVVNGTTVANETVSVSDGSSEPVSFVHAFGSQGTYNVTIDGLSPVQVTVTGPQPDVGVSPTSYNFGTVQTGNYSFGGVWVQNDGQAPLNWTGAAITGLDKDAFYTGLTTSGTIQSGGQAYLTVNLHSTVAGSKNATLEIYSNDTDEGTLSVPLSATVVAPEPNASVTPTTYDFGDVSVGTTVTTNVTVTNDGDGTLTFDGVERSGHDDFEITAGNGTTTLDTGESHEFTVSFSPSVADSLGANLRVLTNDPETPEIGVYASGTGISTAEPNVTVSPTTYSFGTVAVGKNATATIIVGNDGSADLSVSGETFETNPSHAFGVTGGGGSTVVAPGDNHTVTVRFRPSSPGKVATTMFVGTNDTSVSVHLRGNAIFSTPDIGVTPSGHSFGNVSLSDTANATFTVANDGTAPLNVTDLQLVGPNASEYAVQTPTPFIIAPGASKSVTLEFTPNSVGSASVQLRIHSNDTDTPSVNLSEIGGYGIDTQAPTVTVTDVSGTFETGSTVYANDTVRVTATADGTPEQPTDVWFVLNSTFTNYHLTTNATYDSSSGNWTATIDLSDVVDDGQYDLKAVAIDAGGNRNDTTADDAVVIDRSPTEIASTVSRDSATAGRVNVTSDETLRGGTLSVTVSRPDGTDVTVPMTDVGDRWTGTFPLGSSYGQYNLSATALDLAGNRGNSTATASIQNRSTDANDTITVKLVPSNLFVRFHTDVPVKDTFITVAGSHTPLAPLSRGDAGVSFLNAKLEHKLSGNLSYATIGIPVNASLLKPGTDASDVTIRHYNETTGKWEDVPTTVENVTLPDGTHGQYWVANVTHFSTYGAVVTDTTPPTVTTTNPTDGHEFAAGTSNPTLRVEFADALSGVNASAVSVAFDGASVTDSAATQISSQSVEYSPTALANGSSHDLAVTVVDEAGNSHTETLSFSVAEPSSGSSGGTNPPSGGSSGGTNPPSGGSSGDNNPPGSETPPSDIPPIDMQETNGHFAISVTGTHGDSTVDLDFANGSATGDGVATGDISFQHLTLVVDTDFNMHVSASDAPPTDGPALTLDGVSSLGYLNVSHPMLRDQHISNVTFRFVVSRSTLDDSGISPDDVTLYRHHDGPWTALDTRLVATTDSAYVFEATSPGLSTFAVGVPADQSSTMSTTGTTQTTTTISTTTGTATTGTTKTTHETTPSTSTSGTTAGTGTTTNAEKSSAGGGFVPLLLVGLLVILGLIGGGLYLRSRR